MDSHDLKTLARRLTAFHTPQVLLDTLYHTITFSRSSYPIDRFVDLKRTAMIMWLYVGLREQASSFENRLSQHFVDFKAKPG